MAKAGQKVSIPVGALDFVVGGNTIWVQSPEGGTTMRIKCAGKINVNVCQHSPISHVDIMVPGDIEFCISKDAEI